MKAIKELEKLGYVFSINNEGNEAKISFQYTGEDEPDPEKVDPFFAELKANRQEALSFVRASAAGEQVAGIVQSSSTLETGTVADENLCSFQSQFEGCMGELNNLLGERDGLTPFLENNYPELLTEIGETEAELDSIWQKGIEGVATNEHFREVLKCYYQLNEKAIQLFIT